MNFVRRNIIEFGGDPDSVLIFGESAGAGSGKTMMQHLRLGQWIGLIGANGPVLLLFSFKSPNYAGILGRAVRTSGYGIGVLFAV